MDRVNNSGKKIVIGLTGKPASCVAAILLKKQGFDVIGVSIVTNTQSHFDSSDDIPSCHIKDLEEVKNFCQSLNIPFYATDAKPRFDAEVFDPLVARKLMGLANNSCFNCTKMKIQVLKEKMDLLNADYIATGHFCKVYKNLNSQDYFIHSNSDPTVDQAYLLAGLSNEYLEHLILPLGELRAVEVEKIAKKFNIQNPQISAKKDFCFEAKSSYYNQGVKRIPPSMLKTGQVYSDIDDSFLGDHGGMFSHYLGEKELKFQEGIFIDKKLEIIDYDEYTGIIKVGNHESLTHKSFQLVSLHLSKSIDRAKPLVCFIKIPKVEKLTKCHLYFKNNNSALIVLDSPAYPILPADTFVIFDKDGRNAKAIGLGEISQIGDFKLIDRVKDFRGSIEEGETSLEVSEYSRFLKF